MVRFAPGKLARTRIALVRLALDKRAPFRDASVKFTWLRSALGRLQPLRFAFGSRILQFLEMEGTGVGITLGAGGTGITVGVGGKAVGSGVGVGFSTAGTAVGVGIGIRTGRDTRIGVGATLTMFVGCGVGDAVGS